MKSNQLAQFKNIHQYEKALLLCNGSSLNKVDFSRIDTTKVKLFGLNKIFLGFDKFAIKPDYLVAVNKKVLEQSAEKYNNLDIVKFISNRVSPQLIPENPYTHYINTTNIPKTRERFSKNICEYVHEGWTVTHAALQIIYYMGFGEVYIVGMDHYFSQHIKGQENRASYIKGDDNDHFDPKYFGHGQSWDLPDLVNSEISYQAALDAYQSDGRKIYDCTINGACQIFPKMPVQLLYTQGVDSTLNPALNNLFLKEIHKKISPEMNSLTVANNLFRCSQYTKAIQIYILLYTQNPLQIYLNNAFMCSQKMGLKPVLTFQDLLEELKDIIS
ncbi:6-hydroxymethylpterin diphosphokinase MptE-like protein [Candidatus Albibeggiatoa sp. nov. NOAA]|uniref:6-hydroxymethylpterin diphosphokinase MptE-like protein n=1 Tax=Candidatus Albibeggiatoa sp. nov. NOAA TaxID=3162724 RepID=UPI0032F6FCD7|nr:DUF115 domain-containing protein [Thiotrichaceae bacterium]